MRNGSDWNYRVLWSSRGAAALLLNRPERPKDPREDQEQMEYLEAWKKKYERTDKEK